MDDLSCIIEYDEHGESKAATVVEASHQGCCLCGFLCTLRLARVVVDVDILEVVADQLADSRVVGDEIGKAQAPGTPIATHLTHHELAVGLGLRECLVNLLQRVDVFVIYLFQRRLGIHHGCKPQGCDAK